MNKKIISFPNKEQAPQKKVAKLPMPDNNTVCDICHYQFQVSRDNLIAAVNDGGDADTIAALSGGLAGARYGYTAIPSEWLSVLEKDTTAELEKIADFICTHI